MGVRVRVRVRKRCGWRLTSSWGVPVIHIMLSSTSSPTVDMSLTRWEWEEEYRVLLPKSSPFFWWRRQRGSKGHSYASLGYSFTRWLAYGHWEVSDNGHHQVLHSKVLLGCCWRTWCRESFTSMRLTLTFQTQETASQRSTAYALFLTYKGILLLSAFMTQPIWILLWLGHRLRDGRWARLYFPVILWV